MTGDDWVQIIWYVMAFTLLISALAARRIPMGNMVKMIALWAVIFGAVFLLATAWRSLGR